MLPAFELRVRPGLLPLPFFAATSLVAAAGAVSRPVGGGTSGTAVGEATGFALLSTVALFLDAALFAGVVDGLGGTIRFTFASADVAFGLLDAAAAAAAAAFWLVTDAAAGLSAGMRGVLAFAGGSRLMPTFDGRFPEDVAEFPSRLAGAARTG